MQLLRRRSADAHEAPVYVAHQERVYFTTKPDLDSEHPSISIKYWDLADDGLHTWVADARMANGMALSCDASCLLVCEQGDRRRRAAIARYHLEDGRRECVVDGFAERPFNSPNKVVEHHSGILLLSDPDYGVRQGFRQNSPLTPALYAHYPDGDTTRLDLGLEQPHGLALSPNHDKLYVTDTSADDGVGGFDASRQRDTYACTIDYAAKMPLVVGPPEHLAKVPVGIPDGMAVSKEGLIYAATGDGVRIYQPGGQLVEHLTIEGGAVNVFLDEPGARLFVTTDEAVEVWSLSA